MSNNHPNYKAVAITGSIGSGKSLAADIIRDKGYKVLCADRIGHQVLEYPEVKERLISLFGESILQDGENRAGKNRVSSADIDREALGKIVFSDSHKLKLLNDTIHPHIISYISSEIEMFKQGSFPEYKKPLLFFEVPLLFETNLQDMFDITINIAALEEQRITRLITARAMSESDVRKRIAAQLPDDFKESQADITIRNDSSITSLKEKVHSLIREIEASA